MSETALKFGPEWLRALSHGGVSSPPSSPGPVKFKMAEYRYGREEMLALFDKDYPPPEEIHNFGSLCIDEVQEPLAFLPMNTEEQRIWQRCVNSEAVLRGTGRAPINGVGRGRGGSVERGRGRGRGVGAPYYSRGLSYDEEEGRPGPREGGPPGMGGRGRGYERSQSVNDSRGWGERIPERSGPPGAIIEDRSGATSPRKEQNRAANENWRSRNSEEEGDRWRALGNSNRVDKWPRSGWREREGGEGEWEDRGGAPGGGIRMPRPMWDMERDKRRAWEDDNLPEWATEEMEEKGGSFDATGAFHAPGSSDESEASNENEKNDITETSKKKKNETNSHPDQSSKEWPDPKRTDFPKEAFSKNIKEMELRGKELEKSKESDPNRRQSSPLVNGLLSEEESSSISPSPPQLNESKPKVFASMMPPHLDKDAQLGEEEKLDHMQSVADDLVAKLVEEDEPARHQSHLHPPPPGGLNPQSESSLPNNEEQWFYTDPQGDIQGPFSSSDMSAWYKLGYFKPTLLLRRQCDDKFAQLGDLTGVFGRVPFLPGPVVPPLKVSELLNAQKAQVERERLLQLQNQLYQHQVTLRQQQVYQHLQSQEEWSSLTMGQQQQLFMQYYMAHPPHAPSAGAPTSLQNSNSSLTHSTTSSNGTAPLPTPGGPGDSRPSLSSSSSAASLSQPQDPIQAFVAQMASKGNVGGTNSEPISMPMAPPTETPVNSGGSPLQRLLSQLQRGSGQTSMGGTTENLNASNITPPTFTNHPQAAGSVPPHLNMEKPDQADPIQSLMNQLSKMQQPPTSGESFQQQEELRQREEEQKRIEEERRLFEEKKRQEEERLKQHEMRIQEEMQRGEEEKKELVEKNQRLEEELRRIQMETRRKHEVAEHQRKEEKRKLLQIEQHKVAAEAAKKEEEQKREQRIKYEEEMLKKEEDIRKQEQERERIDEERKKKEKKKIEEEKKKQEAERLKREEKERQLQHQEEMRRLAVEEEKRRMQQLKEEERKKAQEEQERLEQQKLLQERMKQLAPAWCNPGSDKNNPPSLAEIQKAQEIKERKEREAESQREAQRQKEALKQAAEEKKQMEATNKWSSRSSHSGKKGSSNPLSDSNSHPPVKSLVEIQKEEEKELKKRLEKEQAERAAAVSHLSLNAAGVWGSAAQSLSWANRASTGSSHPSPPVQQSQAPSNPAWSGNMMWSAVAQTNANTNTPQWSQENTISQPTGQNLGGFWESPNPVKASKPATNASSNVTRSPPKVQSNSQQANNKATSNSSQSVNQNNKANKKKKDESENVKKLFTENITPSDNFMQWCKSSLHAMKVHASIDIPTFVGFLADVESPYEVHDYIRSYLGDSKEVKEFAKQYLERRSRARHAHKMRQDEDNILAPAPAVNPITNQDFQEVKTRLKKGSRKKMQKVDSSILGFSVTSNERMNVEGN